jgi:hypothetical protein
LRRSGALIEIQLRRRCTTVQRRDEDHRDHGNFIARFTSASRVDGGRIAATA